MAHEKYGTAQVCLNGHLINSSVEEHPKRCKAHCDTCGAETITACPACQQAIRGTHYIAFRYEHPLGHVNSIPIEKPPAYCEKCGEPFPWTATAIQTAVELLAEDLELNDDETAQLTESISEAVRDTPRATLGGTRIRRYLQKAGKHVAEAVRELIVDLVAESVKRIIWPDE